MAPPQARDGGLRSLFHMSACADLPSVSQVTSKLYTIKFNHTNRLILCPILIKRKVMKVFRKERM